MNNNSPLLDPESSLSNINNSIPIMMREWGRDNRKVTNTSNLHMAKESKANFRQAQTTSSLARECNLETIQALQQTNHQ